MARGESNMEKTIRFTVNNQPRSVTTDPERPLLDVLREDLQLVGTKYGCGEGKCRACTVLIGGKSRASCITSVASADIKSALEAHLCRCCGYPKILNAIKRVSAESKR